MIVQLPHEAVSPGTATVAGPWIWVGFHAAAFVAPLEPLRLSGITRLERLPDDVIRVSELQDDLARTVR